MEVRAENPAASPHTMTAHADRKADFVPMDRISGTRGQLREPAWLHQGWRGGACLLANQSLLGEVARPAHRCVALVHEPPHQRASHAVADGTMNLEPLDGMFRRLYARRHSLVEPLGPHGIQLEPTAGHLVRLSGFVPCPPVRASVLKQLLHRRDRACGEKPAGRDDVSRDPALHRQAPVPPPDR